MKGKTIVLWSFCALTVAETSLPENIEQRVTAAARTDYIEKVVCKFASQKDIEDKETAKTCKLLKKKAPFFHFAPDCRTVVENVWDSVKANCPKTQKATLSFVNYSR